MQRPFFIHTTQIFFPLFRYWKTASFSQHKMLNIDLKQHCNNVYKKRILKVSFVSCCLCCFVHPVYKSRTQWNTLQLSPKSETSWGKKQPRQKGTVPNCWSSELVCRLEKGKEKLGLTCRHLSEKSSLLKRESLLKIKKKWRDF